ncbi:MAG: hypothetical protein IH899_01305 [Planctomycetes bacterium]|nr:hypothetical protein [Planctomycetota bacterium]
MSKLISPPSEVYGGKAAVLLELQSAGFRVPDFFVSPSDLAEAVNSLGTPLAVRSSATVEDGETVSFAGQFRSYLNLWSLEEVEAAVRKCRESVQAPSVVEYCRRNGVDPSSLRMEVIVQRMIQPELAGVAFTVNPVTGAEEVFVEACEGLADELLAGRKTALPHDHHLVKKYFPKIETTARKIQRHFGAPQDIEFAVEDETLYILQSRPITRIGFAPDIGEWTNADFRDGGVSSGVCTPLMWSLYDFIWEDTLKGFLREIKLLDSNFEAGRMFFGRPYWNLGAVKQCLAKMPGFVEREFDTDLSVQIQYEGDGICTPVTVFGLLRAIPTLFAIRSFFRNQEQLARQFLTGGFDAIERKYEPISGDVDSAFRKLVEQDYFTTESNYFRTIYAASFAKLDFKMSFPEADYTSLVAALPEMRHMAPTRTLREMAACGDRDVSPLLRTFRHHCRWGLDIREARWDEDREFVEELLCRLPASAVVDPRPAYEQARAEALSRLPARKRKSFNRKLDRLRTFVWLREEMRDLSSRMYYLIRRYVLEIAKRRGIGDDIFFMTFREIFKDDRSNIDRNREIYESYRHFKAPNEIGARFTFGGGPPQGALRGIGASRGTVRGIARVAHTVEEAMRAEKGAILVCPFTDPGWTPVLDRVAGVVTETGGLLSHAAVICREYAIPAVLGVPEATQRIPDGRTVVVHGDDGYVDLVD